MINPPSPFQIAVSEALSSRLFTLASREPEMAFSCFIPSDLLPRILDIDLRGASEVSAVWLEKMRPLASEASRGLSADDIPPAFAAISQIGFQPDHGWLKGTRTYLEDVLKDPLECLCWIERIRKEPESREVWLDYADWLTSRHDLRGEWIRLEDQLEATGPSEERAKIQDRLKSLEQEVEMRFRRRLGLGPKEHRFVWEKGHLAHLTICSDHESYLRVLESEEAFCLRSVDFVPSGSDDFQLKPLRAVARSLHLKLLRSLDLTEHESVTTYPGHAGLRIVAEYPNARQLTDLNLREGKLYEEGVAVLAGSPDLKGLRRLNLRGNRIQDGGVIALAKSPYLQSLVDLDLRQNPIGDEGIRTLVESQNFLSLRRLNLSGTDITGEAIRALAAFPHLPSLTTLDLGYCKISVEDLRILLKSPHLRNLARLGLSSIGIGTEEIRKLLELHEFKLLTGLDLKDNPLEDEGIRALATSPHLGQPVYLSLSATRFGAEGLRALAASPLLQSLKVMDLSSNFIGDEGVRILAASPHLGSLEILELTENDCGVDGLRALAASPHLKSLKVLSWEDNRMGDEGRLVMDEWTRRTGIQLDPDLFYRLQELF